MPDVASCVGHGSQCTVFSPGAGDSGIILAVTLGQDGTGASDMSTACSEPKKHRVRRFVYLDDSVGTEDRIGSYEHTWVALASQGTWHAISGRATTAVRISWQATCVHTPGKALQWTETERFT